MRIIGLDLGTKTLGVAVSDKLGLIASFYKTIFFESEDYNSLVPKVKELLDEFDTKIVVLGLPKNMDNSLGFASDRSLNFKKLLEDNLDIQVILEDERLSSVEANNILISGDMSRKKRKNKVDSVAASIILQRYLDRRN